MALDLKKLAECICKVAEEENNELLEITENPSNATIGLFHMPELAFAYECGKHIMLNAKEIFGDNVPKWEREINLGNGGPTDLVFIFGDGQKIAIEFKMRDTIDSYKSDITKLSNIQDNNVIKLFCAVVDVFTKDLGKDGRVQGFEDDPNIKNLCLENFVTHQTWYKTEVSAVVGVWQLIK